MGPMQTSGWQPAWQLAETQLRDQAEALRSLRGRRIVESWIVWFLDEDEWFADLPVVFRLDDGRQLEVSWKSLDQLSISWDTIDTSVPPTWWNDWTLEWRPRAHPALEAVTGHEVVRVDVTEYLFTTRGVQPPSPPSSVWLTTGIWLDTGGSGLHVFNALDENGLSNDPPVAGPEHRHAGL